MSSAADNSNLLTQAIAEYMRRVDAGEAVDREQFLQANAQAGDELRQYLDNVALVEQMAGPTPAEQSQHATADGARRETIANTQGGDSVPEKRATITDGQITGRFGRYKIEKTLGEGAMGTVFLARDTQLDRQVALKVPKFKDDDTEMMERFYREARAAARLRHRHICPVHDIGEIDGVRYISIGYVDGHPLSSFVSAENPPAERNVAIVVRKLALALDVAHRDGIIHRDLKPANVMVDRKSEPVIMDFGLARQINKQENERLTQTGTIMGSPAYMSPEQVHADNEKIGACSDIYSLGVMLYELLTGHLPFEGSIAAVIGQILMKEPKKPSSLRPDLDPRLEAICERMMAKEIDKRYGSMKEVADALTAFLKNEGQPGAQRSVGKLESFAPVELKEVETQPNTSRRTVARKQQEPRPADTFNTRDQISDGQQTVAGSLKNLPRWVWAAAGTCGAVVLLGVITLIFKSGNQTIEIVVDDPAATVSIQGDVVEVVRQGKEGRITFTGKPGEVGYTWTLERNGETLSGSGSFTLKEGMQTPIRIVTRDDLPADDDTAIAAEEAPIAEPAGTTEPTGTVEPSGEEFPIGKWVRLLENKRQLREWQATDTAPEIQDGVVTLERGRRTDATDSGNAKLERLFDSTVERFIVHVRHKKVAGFMAGESVRVGSINFHLAHFGPDKHELWTTNPNGKGSAMREVHHSTEGLKEFADCDYVFLDGKFTAYLNGKEICSYAAPSEPLASIKFDVRVFRDQSTVKAEWQDVAIMRLSDEQAAAIREGTLPGSPPPPNAKTDGHALFLDGVDDWIEIPAMGLNKFSSLTFEAWTTPEVQRSGRWGNLFDSWGNWGNRSDRGGLRVSTEQNGDVTNWWAWVHDPKTGRSGNIGRPVAYGQRTHLAVSMSGREMVLFVDGERVGRTELPTDYHPVDKPLLIGTVRNDDHIVSHYCGSIDEIRLSSSARYSEHFTPPAEFEADAETIALYRVDDGGGGRLVDSSGNGHHGEIHGATWRAHDYRPPKRWRVTSVAPNDRVLCVAWHPQQNLVAVGSDRFIRLYEVDASGFKLRQLVEGHTSLVRTIAWSPDGSRFASGSNDSTIRLWDTDGTSIAQLNRHRGNVNDIAWSPDGNWIASAGDDDTVRLWKADGSPDITVKADASRARCVVWNHGSQQFAAVGDDRIVKIWHRDGSAVRQLEPLEARGLSLDWSRDGTRIVAGDESGNVRLFNAADGEQLGALKLPDDHWSDQVYDLAFSPDGKQIAIGTEINLRIWDGEAEESAAVTIEPIDYDYDVNGIRALSWSPTGDRIVTGGDDGSVRSYVWDGKSQLPTAGPMLRGNRVFPTTVAWSPDGTRLAAGLADWTVRTWKQDGTPQVVAKGHERIDWGAIRTVGWNADGNSLYSCGRLARTWDADGKPMRKFTGHQHRTQSAASNPVKPMLASGGFFGDKTIRLWSPDESGTIDVTIDGPLSDVLTLAWSPDGTRLVSGGGRHREEGGKLVEDYDVRVWSVEGEQQQAMGGHTSAVVDADWSPDGKWIATAGNDRTVRLWQPDGTAGHVLNHWGWVRGVSFSTDSQRLATGCSDNLVHIWNVAGEEQFKLQRHRENVTDVDWNPQDDNLIASTASDGMICIWNVRRQRLERILYPLRDGESLMLDDNGRLLQGDAGMLQNEIVFLVEDQADRWTMLSPAEFWQRGIENDSVAATTAKPQEPAPSQPKEAARSPAEVVPAVIATLGGHQSAIRGVRFTNDAHHLVSVDDSGAVRQWNGQTGNVTSQYSAGACFGMAVSADGKVLATTHREPNLVKLWSLTEQRQLGVLKTSRPGSKMATAVAFSPDGASLTAVSYDNMARSWDLKTGVQRHQFAARDLKEEHNASGAGVVYTPDSRFVLVRRSATKLPCVIAFDLRRRQVDNARSFKTEHGTYGQLAISPDGQELALTNYVGPTEFFKIGEEGEPAGISMAGGQYLCSWSPDGKSIAIGSTGRVVLFDAETHVRIVDLEMPNQDARIQSIDFSPNGDYLVAGEADGKDVPRPSDYKIRIWRLSGAATETE